MSLRNVMGRIKMWASIPGFVVRRLHWNDAFGVLLVGVKTLAASRAACSEVVVSPQWNELTREEAELLIEAADPNDWPRSARGMYVTGKKVDLAFRLSRKRPDWISHPLFAGSSEEWFVCSSAAGVEAGKQALKRFGEEDRKREKESAAADDFCDACVDQEAGFGSCGHHWIDRDGVQS